MEHLFARYREIRPLFFVPARPIYVEWKMRPYFGVLVRVFKALQANTKKQMKQMTYKRLNSIK